MKTEYKFAEALKTMMAQMPLDEISVTLLSKKCHVKRQTFYYHFHDIYDLLTLVFLNEKIEGAVEAKNFNELINAIFKYYSKNTSFIEATLNSAGKELVEEFINNSCYRSLYKIISEIPESKKITYNDKKLIARFYSLAISNSVVYYLTAYKTKTFAGLLNCFAFLQEGFLEKAVATLDEKRSKK